MSAIIVDYLWLTDTNCLIFHSFEQLNMWFNFSSSNLKRQVNDKSQLHNSDKINILQNKSLIG